MNAGVLYLSGSPRADGNTDRLLERMRTRTGGELLRLADLHIAHCRACWACREAGACAIADDMTATVVPHLLASRAVVIGSPVFFNNVTADAKACMDRTWCLRGRLRDKLGAAVVVGRRYGSEGAIAAIHACFLKHEMIVAHRGVCGLAFAKGEVDDDAEALRAADGLADRLLGLLRER